MICDVIFIYLLLCYCACLLAKFCANMCTDWIMVSELTFKIAEFTSSVNFGLMTVYRHWLLILLCNLTNISLRHRRNILLTLADIFRGHSFIVIGSVHFLTRCVTTRATVWTHYTCCALICMHVWTGTSHLWPSLTAINNSAPILNYTGAWRMVEH